MKKSRSAAVTLLLGGTLVLLSSCGHAPKKKDPPPPPLSSEFSLTKGDLTTMASNMPATIQQKILTKPEQFLREMGAILREPAIHLSLVDKQHQLPTGYEPTDLVRLSSYGLSVSRSSVEMRKAIMPHVMAMVTAARTDHVVLLFSSTYRSFATQRAVYDREVRLYGKKVADTESAVPGHSQHQMGTTVDFGCICNQFANTGAFKWLTEHAWKYGFSMTYPKGYASVTGYRYEPWHWHYITVAGTTAQRDFFDNIQQYLLEFIFENSPQLVSSYHGSNLGPGWKPTG